MFQLARLMDERMAKRHLVLSEGGIAQMSNEDAFLFFAAKIVFPLFALHVLIVARSLPNRPKHVGERCGGSRFGYPVWCLARFWTGDKDCRTRAVLPAVVLLLHEKRQLRPTEIANERWRFAQDHHRHGTFVFDFIGHIQFC